MSKFKNRNRQTETITKDDIETVNVSDLVEPSTIEPPTGEDVPVEPNNFAEAAAKIEEAGGDASAPTEPTTTKTRGVIPDALGNNVKGERHCSNCGVKESDMLAQNPRYSLCKGVCVKCYGKLHRKSKKPEDMTVEEIQAKIDHYTELLAKKNGSQGRVEDMPSVNSDETKDEASIDNLGAPSESTGISEDLAEISN